MLERVDRLTEQELSSLTTGHDAGCTARNAERARGAESACKLELLLCEAFCRFVIAEREMGQRSLRPPREVTRGGDHRSRQAYAGAQEVLEPFGDSPLFDPQPSAGKAQNCGRDESALCFKLERRELLLCRLEIALIDERLDQQSAVQNAVRGWCRKLGRFKRCPRVHLGGAQIAASQREPAAARQAHGKPAAVAGHARPRDRGIEQRPYLGIPLGPKQRERRPRKGCGREPRPVVQ